MQRAEPSLRPAPILEFNEPLFNHPFTHPPFLLKHPYPFYSWNFSFPLFSNLLLFLVFKTVLVMPLAPLLG